MQFPNIFRQDIVFELNHVAAARFVHGNQIPQTFSAKTCSFCTTLALYQ
jgi:hypothetical protein